MTPEQLEKLFAYIDARIDERAVVQGRDDFEHDRKIRERASQTLRRDLERDVRWKEED